MIKYIIIAMLFSNIAIAEQSEISIMEYAEYVPYIMKKLDNKFIIINRGSQQLVLVENRQPVLTMKVIVGKRGWETPLKETSIVSIITNPSWHVPKSINSEIKRKIDRDPVKSRKQGYIISTNSDGTVKYTQLSGPFNVLGKVKFRLSNIGNIYMHDTSAKYLFNEGNRKLSHGCIRLEKPMELLKHISDIDYKPSKYPKQYKVESVPVYIVDWKY